MGVDYITCDVCKENRCSEYIIVNLHEHITCNNDIANFLTKDENNLLDNMNWCHHVLCSDDLNCCPLGTDYATEFKKLINEIRENKISINDVENKLKCKRCIEEEEIVMNEKIIIESIDYIINNFNKLKKSDIKEKLIEFKKKISIYGLWMPSIVF